MSRIEAILFDLGGVMIELAGVERMLEWSPTLGTTEELWRRWLSSPAVRDYETGRTDRVTFADAIVGEFGLPVDAETFLGEFAWWPRSLHPDAGALLAALAPRYRLASLSNTNELHWHRFARDWDLPAMFHHNFPSFMVGKLKPDAEYFEHALDALGIAADRALFVDDNRINVEAARAVGLHARQVPRFEALAPTLAELGIHASAPGSAR